MLLTKVITMIQPPVNHIKYHGSVCVGGVFNLKAGDVITLTAHYYPYKYGPKIYMDFKHSYIGAFF